MVTQLQKKRLRLFKDRLNILLDIAQTINEDHSIDDLLSEFEILLREELEVGKILVFTNADDVWKNLLNSGVTKAEVGDIDVERDLIQYQNIENITISHPPQLKGFDAVIPLFHRYKAIGFVLIGDVDEEHTGISPTIKHLKLIQIISNLIIVFIENKRMQNALLEQEIMRKEMELASRIQTKLVPADNHLPVSNKYNIHTFYHPQFEVGGDYYDFIRLSKSVLGFCIADVSGKGISAAMLMSNFQAVFRTLYTPNINLKKLAHQLNKKVNQSANNEKFITMFLGKYNTITRKLTYINAGHLPPILFDPKKKTLNNLDKGCIGLGMLDDIPAIELGKIRVPRNAKFLAFTDGLVELENGDQIESGMEPIEEIISNEESIESNMTALKELIKDQLETGSVFDDITITGIEFK
ncbi:PP2C family protein-serine/threonine phosphatase [Labilibacter marinus]|uniref:PP2C family protein-serine/threonine phosphatase n=1 Tax=Labilibacter marinus TaxID=1477105 RepID=UPI000836F57D|nr:SpoIIE family protein phosphatase [Labilibacter marinus]